MPPGTRNSRRSFGSRMRSATRVTNSSMSAAPYNIMSRVTSLWKPNTRQGIQQTAQTMIETHGVSVFFVTLANTRGNMPSRAMARGRRE